jgi:chaperonin cofactor prefoldin
MRAALCDTIQSERVCGGEKLRAQLMNPREAADLIERFLEDSSLYPQEGNDFVEASQRDKDLDVYRKRCDELDPRVNCPGVQDSDALVELRAMVKKLRAR